MPINTNGKLLLQIFCILFLWTQWNEVTCRTSSYSYSSYSSYRAPTSYSYRSYSYSSYRAPTSYSYRSYSSSYSYRSYSSYSYRSHYTYYSTLRKGRYYYSYYSPYIIPYYSYYYSLYPYYRNYYWESRGYGVANDPDSGNCANFDASDNGSYMGYFSCPMDLEPDTFTDCCGESDSEYCCESTLLIPPAAIAGIVIGSLVILVTIGVCIAYCTCLTKRKVRSSTIITTTNQYQTTNANANYPKTNAPPAYPGQPMGAGGPGPYPGQPVPVGGAWTTNASGNGPPMPPAPAYPGTNVPPPPAYNELYQGPSTTTT